MGERGKEKLKRPSRTRSSRGGTFFNKKNSERRSIFQSRSQPFVTCLPPRLIIGARSSPLSRAQVEEFKRELGVEFDVLWVETIGDQDRTTSLRSLEKTDFFTRELDQLLLQGAIDGALHSAKDLPDPLPTGLKVALLTQGIDPRDALVFREPLRVVATSSERREESVKALFPDCRFVDLRGTIHERLSKWERGEVDGVVIAEAALIRLHLTALPRVFLPGPTAPLQGKLAFVCRENSTWDSILLKMSSTTR